MVTGMINNIAAQARTALSPEWDRGFDEAFTDLVTGDPDWVRDEFDALIGANWDEPPEPPEPPAPSTDRPEPHPSRPGNPKTTPARTTDQIHADRRATQRSPP